MALRAVCDCLSVVTLDDSTTVLTFVLDERNLSKCNSTSVMSLQQMCTHRNKPINGNAMRMV